jgi:hypothetical protein
MIRRITRWSRVWPMTILAIAATLSIPAARAQELRQILIGYEIAPVPLDLTGKDWALVGLGSYLVNTTGCNDCHTHPNWTPHGNPYLGQPERINARQYLTGGREFGAITSANITPNKAGRPAGLTLAGFLEVMRIGHDPDDPPGVLLQVMPWPLYRSKTDREMAAMYQYLQAIPSRPDNPNPGP